MNPDNNAVAHSSTVAGAPIHPAARACIQHTWFATHESEWDVFDYPGYPSRREQ